jgi:CRISP-associated protein Cas1
MIGGIVEIAQDGKTLSISRGFLSISDGVEVVGKVPLDDISSLILSARQSLLSRAVMVELAKRKSTIVICGDNYHPISLIWPFEAHHRAAALLYAQINASLPLKKQLWKIIVIAKIKAQINALTLVSERPEIAHKINPLLLKIKSGDPDNREAQAARYYWTAMMGTDFRRDRTDEGINSLLNYGYIVLRAATARAICAAGLHPTLGLHHKSDVNSFALVDDLMEPFRPIIDIAVKKLANNRSVKLTPETKRELVAILQQDLVSDKGISPVINCLMRAAQSLGKSLEDGKADLDIAQLNSPGVLL